MKQTIAGYLRLSRDGREGLVAQRRALQRLADRHGYELAEEEIVYDVGPGGSLASRPALCGLLQRVRRRELRAIVVSGQDRLSRDQEELETIKILLAGACDLVTSDGVIAIDE